MIGEPRQNLDVCADLLITKFVDVMDDVVWRNFSILGPKLVLAYAEDVLSDSRLKIVLNVNLDDASL